MTIAAMNFKVFERGSMRGFFDLRYHGLTIKGCRLMESNNGLWIALPSRQVEQDGQTKYLDIVELTKSEADHVRRLVVADLESQGHLARPARQERPQGKPKSATQPSARPARRSPEGEDLSEYYSNVADDDGDIPF